MNEKNPMVSGFSENKSPGVDGLHDWVPSQSQDGIVEDIVPKVYSFGLPSFLDPSIPDIMTTPISSPSTSIKSPKKSKQPARKTGNSKTGRYRMNKFQTTFLINYGKHCKDAPSKEAVDVIAKGFDVCIKKVVNN